MQNETDSKILAGLAAIPDLVVTIRNLSERLEAIEEALRDLKPQRQKRFYSVKETAVELGLSDKTVRDLIERGLLKASRATRHIKIPHEEIEAYRGRTTL